MIRLFAQNAFGNIKLETIIVIKLNAIRIII